MAWLITRHLLAEEFERALLRLEAQLTQRPNSTQANCMLLTAYNPTLLCLHKILAS